MDNPRYYNTNLGTMWFHHGRYELGDPNSKSVEETIEFMRDNSRNIMFQPVYMMDHSGLTLATQPFGGIYGYFDSGQIGFIWASKIDIRNWFGVRHVTKSIRNKVKQRFAAELKAYEAYLNGYEETESDDVQELIYNY